MNPIHFQGDTEMRTVIRGAGGGRRDGKIRLVCERDRAPLNCLARLSRSTALLQLLQHHSTIELRGTPCLRRLADDALCRALETRHATASGVLRNDDSRGRYRHRCESCESFANHALDRRELVIPMVLLCRSASGDILSFEPQDCYLVSQTRFSW